MTGVVHLASAADTIRLSLHVAAACVWIGGQVVVAGLVPTLRGFGGDATQKVASVFARIAWPAFIVLIITGVWNITALNNGGSNSTWKMVLGMKIGVVLLAAVAVALHTRVSSAKAKGISAGLGMLASLVAMVMGVVLAG
jgi:putative copper export protein